MHQTFAPVRRVALAAAALALAACNDAPVAPTPPLTIAASVGAVEGLHGGRLATIEFQGRFPALFIQQPDGSDRFRVRFENVRDRIEGNYPPDLLPVRDETILALGPAKWSPDGQQLAIVVSLGFDQSQVVVMNADGRNMRTVSPNGQIIMGDIDWAPDSRAIAYAMSTNFHGAFADIFTTDLVKDEVRRITDRGLVTVFTEYRWDPTGRRIWFTDFEGWTDDGINRVYRLSHADLDGGLTQTDRFIVGDPQGLARDGSWALALRWPRKTDYTTREFVRLPLDGGEETILAAGDLPYAELLEGDDAAVLVANVSEDPYQTVYQYDVMGLARPRDHRGTLRVDPAAASMALVRGEK